MGVKVGATYALEVADEIAIKCGAAVIVMKKDGTIIIEGKDITVKGSGKINIKASSEITMKGSKINEN
jgi:type VI secretion system secreted protein VgrG